jgi:putative phosphoesterase
MKWMIASDLHGSAYWCEKLVEAFRREGADRLILLGDTLYHGPRNPLPEGHNPQGCVEALSWIKDKTVGVRGNCDAAIDQVLLPFPMMADYALLPLEDGRCAFVTHGHLFSCDNPPPHQPGDVLINGHFHVYAGKQVADFHYVNPGSAALPKENQQKSYMIYEDGIFIMKTLEDGAELMRYKPE